MENTKYYHTAAPFEDSFILAEKELNDAREWYKNEYYEDDDDCSFDEMCDVFPVFDFDIDNGLFVNGAGDVVYFCSRSGDGWIVNFEGTPEEAAEYQAELFRAKNYCG